MAGMIYLDTHVAVWLYGGYLELLSVKASDLIEKNDCFISPMAQLEMDYLFESGKISVRSEKIVKGLKNDIGLQVSDISFQKIIRSAVKLTWTRDPFDRIIAGEAVASKKKLLTRDSKILSHCSYSVW